MSDIAKDPDAQSGITGPHHPFLYPLSLELEDLSRAMTGLAVMAQLLRQNDDHKDTEHGPTLEDEIVLRLHAGLEGIANAIEVEVDNLQARIAALFAN